MIEVKNIEQLIPEEAFTILDKGVIDSIIGDVADSARAHWVKIASTDTSSFRSDYLLGIQPVASPKQGERIITLVGEIPHMLEDGAPSLDMRTTLLGPNVPEVPVGARGKHPNKKGGFYRAIPFRHTTPGTGNQSGSPMGSAYKGHDAVANAKKMGAAVYRAAKKLDASTTTRAGYQQWGGRLNTSRLRGGLAKGSKGVPLLKPHHKSSIYEGMVKLQKTYEKATQNQYVTFRTISTTTGVGWIRGAIPARHYAEKVNAFVQQLLPKAIEAYLEGNG